MGEVHQRDMEQMRKLYETINDTLLSLEMRMDKMSSDQAESSCAIQSKLDALIRISIAHD